MDLEGGALSQSNLVDCRPSSSKQSPQMAELQLGAAATYRCIITLGKVT